MKIGKLTNDELKEYVLNKLTSHNEETLLGAGVGEDCCAIKIKDGINIISTDPITAASKKAGILAMHINANDIAAAGGQPLAALVTLLIPCHASKENVRDVLDQLVNTAKDLHIDITGGHTEVTDAVNRIVISVTVIGKQIAGKIFKTSDMQEGDAIIMTKYAGLEGSAIIADDYKTWNFSTEENIEIDFINGCVSVIKEGKIAATTKGTHAMHDITEGGVIGAVCEMCEASKLGATINFEKIPVLEITKKLCDFFELDVFRLISSGAMLITTSNPTELSKKLNDEGIKNTVIGVVTKKDVINEIDSTLLFSNGKDELYKCLKK